MKKKYYWKVVHKTEKAGVYSSVVVREGKFCVLYQMGKRITSPMEENGLFVFTTREEARKFKWFSDVIFRVKVEGKEISNITSYDLWKLGMGIKVPNLDKATPLNTTSFPVVTLVEKVY